MVKQKSKKSKKIISVIILAIIVIAIVITGLNYLSLRHLTEVGSEYSKIEYENQLVPEKDENGNWVEGTRVDIP